MAAALAVPSVATAGSAQTWAITCGREQYRPHRIILSCGDAGIWLGNLKWTSWSREQAHATGTYYENTCTPPCSAGHTVSWPVKLTLSVKGVCPGRAHPVFALARLAFPHGVPPLAYHRFQFRCPA